jgi:hypothetical protein
VVEEAPQQFVRAVAVLVHQAGQGLAQFRGDAPVAVPAQGGPGVTHTGDVVDAIAVLIDDIKGGRSFSGSTKGSKPEGVSTNVARKKTGRDSDPRR